MEIQNIKIRKGRMIKSHPRKLTKEEIDLVKKIMEENEELTRKWKKLAHLE